MIFEPFPYRHGARRVIKSTKYSKAESQMTGNRGPGSVQGFRKFGFGTPLGRSVSFLLRSSPLRSMCFTASKKTRKTSKTDLDLAEKRYRDLTKELAP